MLPETSLESQFKALEAGDVDDELNALKRKMALKAAEDERKAIGGEVEAEAEAEADDDDEDEPEKSEDEVKAEIDEAELDAELAELKRKLSAT